MNLKNLFYLAIIFTMTSCATIFTGTKDNITFDSNPSGAQVYIDGLEVCTTPCSTEVKRSLSAENATMKLDGYETRVFELDRKFNVVSIINLTGLIGWAVDAATGSLMKYDRKVYEIDLERKSAFLNDADKIEVDTEAKTVSIYVNQ